MSVKKKRIISIIMAIAIIITIFCATALAMSFSDKFFKKDTPTYIKIGTKFTSTLYESSDYDTYMITVPKNGILKIKLDYQKIIDSVKTAWNVSVYSIDGIGEHTYRELANYKAMWADSSSKWSGLGVSAGQYIIVVKPVVFIKTSNYVISTSFSESNAYEAEPNDVKSEATELKIGYGKNGISSVRENSNDVDWYRFQVNAESRVNLTFISRTNGAVPVVGWRITLLNLKNEKIAQFTARMNDPKMDMVRSADIGLRPGTYYVAVEAQTDECDEYTVLLNSTEAKNIEFELNDSISSATILPENHEIIGSLANRMISLDKDYYKITVPKSGKINITFTHPTENKKDNDNKNGWNIRLYKKQSDGKYYQAVKKVVKWNEETKTINNIGLIAGDYYICIDGDSMSYNSSNYTLKWTHQRVNYFEREPNNTRRTCNFIDIGYKYNGVLISSDVYYDVDYYKFTVTEPTEVMLEFDHEKQNNGNMCWEASIVDIDDIEMVSVTSALNQGHVSTKTVRLPAGVYYVKIDTGHYISEIPYSFKVVR